MPKLDGIVGVIAGGTGSVGEGIVRAFLKEGAAVIVPSRSQEAIDRLLGNLGATPRDRLTTLIGNVGDATDAVRLRQAMLDRFGHIDAVVASLGGTWDEQLKLIDVPIKTWRKYWESNLTPHYVVARTFLPLLADRKGSSYTLLGGMSAIVPVPNYSVVGINSAGHLMMAKVLMEEMKNAQVRINQVMFGFVNTRARAPYARPEWVTADEVGAFCAYLASSEGAMLNGGVMQFGNRPPVS